SGNVALLARSPAFRGDPFGRLAVRRADGIDRPLPVNDLHLEVLLHRRALVNGPCRRLSRGSNANPVLHDRAPPARTAARPLPGYVPTRHCRSSSEPRPLQRRPAPSAATPVRRAATPAESTMAYSPTSGPTPSGNAVLVEATGEHVLHS